MIFMSKNLRVLIIGAQASGKGTQSSLLAKELNLVHISTGNIFREELKKNSELGLKAKSFMEQGLLVPDEIPNQIIMECLQQQGSTQGIVLEGYPRNLNQAKFLSTLLKLDFVFEIKISDQEALKRISSRRTCPKCQKVYSLVANPPQVENVCDIDGSELIIRSDEKEEAVKTRLKIYHQDTEPILNYYREQNILHVINGEQSITGVFADILAIIGA